MLTPKLTVVLFATIITVLAFSTKNAKEAPTQTGTGASIVSALQLELLVSKRTYRVGEPIEILAYLENTSNQTYYVGNELLGLSTISSLHYILVTTEEAGGKVVESARSAATSTWEANATIGDKLSRAYVRLPPNTVFGASERGDVALPPGRYRLRAEYREIEALSWTESERRQLSIPVWTQRLLSNTVNIVVLPRRSGRTSRKLPNVR